MVDDRRQKVCACGCTISACGPCHFHSFLLSAYTWKLVVNAHQGTHFNWRRGRRLVRNWSKEKLVYPRRPFGQIVDVGKWLSSQLLYYLFDSINRCDAIKHTQTEKKNKVKTRESCHTSCESMYGTQPYTYGTRSHAREAKANGNHKIIIITNIGTWFGNTRESNLPPLESSHHIFGKMRITSLWRVPFLFLLLLLLLPLLLLLLLSFVGNRRRPSLSIPFDPMHSVNY